MSDELERIDTSPIQSLAGLRRERGVLEERLSKMEEMRGKVSPEVFQRVQADYEARRSQLDDEAQPLEAAARREWVKLRQLHADCDEALRAAELEREEIDFRFALGELEQAAHQERIGEADRVVGSRRERLEAVGEVRQAFLAVFDSEEELEVGAGAGAETTDEAPEAEPAEVENTGTVVPPADELEPNPDTAITPETEAEAAAGTTDEAAEPAAEPSADDEDEFADDEEPTDVHAVPTAVSPEGAEEATPPPPPPFAGVVTTIGPESDDAGEMTVIIRRARLLQLDADGEAESELMLGSDRVSIGRGSENTIRLDAEAVSRQHAVISSRLGSYMIYDLHSENGTFVNDEVVTERPLIDGDRIRIGTRELVFRAK